MTIKIKRTIQAYRNEIRRLQDSLENAQSVDDENALNIQIDDLRERIRSLGGQS